MNSGGADLKVRLAVFSAPVARPAASSVSTSFPLDLPWHHPWKVLCARGGWMYNAPRFAVLPRGGRMQYYLLPSVKRIG